MTSQFGVPHESGGLGFWRCSLIDLLETAILWSVGEPWESHFQSSRGLQTPAFHLLRVRNHRRRWGWALYLPGNRKQVIYTLGPSAFLGGKRNSTLPGWTFPVRMEDTASVVLGQGAGSVPKQHVYLFIQPKAKPKERVPNIGTPLSCLLQSGGENR